MSALCCTKSVRMPEKHPDSRPYSDSVDDTAAAQGKRQLKLFGPFQLNFASAMVAQAQTSQLASPHSHVQVRRQVAETLAFAPLPTRPQSCRLLQFSRRRSSARSSSGMVNARVARTASLRMGQASFAKSRMPAVAVARESPGCLRPRCPARHKPRKAAAWAPRKLESLTEKSGKLSESRTLSSS